MDNEFAQLDRKRIARSAARDANGLPSACALAGAASPTGSPDYLTYYNGTSMTRAGESVRAQHCGVATPGSSGTRGAASVACVPFGNL